MSPADVVGVSAAIAGAFFLAGALYWVDPPPRSYNQAYPAPASLTDRVALSASLPESGSMTRSDGAPLPHH